MAPKRASRSKASAAGTAGSDGDQEAAPAIVAPKRGGRKRGEVSSAVEESVPVESVPVEESMADEPMEVETKESLDASEPRESSSAKVDGSREGSSSEKADEPRLAGEPTDVEAVPAKVASATQRKKPPPPPKKPLAIHQNTNQLRLTPQKEDTLLFIAQDDLPFEEECIRTPFALKSWLFYLDHKSNEPLNIRSALFERALLSLPGSYKLWKAYTDLHLNTLLDPKSTNPSTSLSTRLVPITSPGFTHLANMYERALVLCNKHPVLWCNYLRLLMHLPCPTRTRRTFDQCLKALPITQHARVWDLYLKFARQCGGETAVRVWRRYLKLMGLEAAEEYVDLLLVGLEDEPTGEEDDDEDAIEQKKAPRYAEAARVLSILMSSPGYMSPFGKTSFQLWTRFCDLVCTHAEGVLTPTSDAVFGSVADSASRGDVGAVSVQGKGYGLVEVLNVEKMIRAGVARFTDQVGRLWNALARWHVALGNFEAARDVYEEAIVKVSTVRDFTMVFDAYAELEESVISARMEEVAEAEGDEDVSEEDRKALGVDVDMRLARLEKLMDRRPFLVNDVLLRQNPHNVNEWDQRANLYRERGLLEKVVETYSEAVATIVPKKSTGKLHLLWTRFATFYEDNGDLELARQVFEKAVNVAYKHVDDLAELWCQWAEMELRNKQFERALGVMGRATVPPSVSKKIPNLNLLRYNDDELSPQVRLFKSLKLWSFYVDLEESIGTIESTRMVYERIMELKIATPQIIINCANFLEEHKWFEESYKAYERGIELFGYPIAFELWNLYLQKFVDRHGATKLERARDLFEHALDKCPPKFAKTLYLLYAKLEEDHGLTRHAMKIYDRATRAVSDADRFSTFELSIAKSVSFFGRTSAREIYGRALEVLPDKTARTMAMRYAQLEASLFEVDRARGIWSYGSQFADPRIDPEFWKGWQEFETKHGNEDTFKEMLRLKRSVQAKFNTDVGFISSQLLSQRAAAAGLVAAETALESELNEQLDNEDRAAGRPVASDAKPSIQQPGGSRIVGFVPAKARTTLSEVTVFHGEGQEGDEEVAGAGGKKGGPANPDAIEISDDDEEEEEEGGAMDLDDRESDQDVDEEGKAELMSLQKKSVPDAVFGGLAKLGGGGGADAGGEAGRKKDLGAKERFKRKR
ncbi:pre-mRNA-splicing factor syf1 [Podochytrium sp. JEL0797]|nr:pre-mRNA-splicing factor syf1 [Podochytrium sp. JEL0797]